MPELPDITVYIESLERRILGATLEKTRFASPFILRTATPPVTSLEGKCVRDVRRLGKRIIFELEDELHLVIHLMIAGRFRWSETPGAKIPGKLGLAAFDFSSGTLILTEASSKKRASIHVVQGREGLEEHRRGGAEIGDLDAKAFTHLIRRDNRTLKRALTDARVFSGIGNAYSDEILFDARMSPMRLTQKLTDEEARRLFESTKAVLARFTAAIRAEVKDGFPSKVTAFRDDMMVHGRYRQPCRVCQTRIMRVTYAEKNDLNYCPKCQNEGRLLADRSLSRLMKKDWPKTIEELE